MRLIALTNGLEAKVSARDYDWLRPYPWRAVWPRVGDDPYAAADIKDENGKYQRVYMHRLITKAPRALKVDHADRDRLNNQRDNLRLATSLQNNMNCFQENMWGYKGVWFNKGKYVARIMWNGDRINLGRFATKEEAARAYDAKAFELYGEFAHLNFRDELVRPQIEEIPAKIYVLEDLPF